MNLLNFEYEVIPSECDEKTSATEPGEMVLELSKQKALDVAAKIPADRDVFVVGADTIVVFGSQILGKPKDRGEAFRMLKGLCGTVHKVYTGVTIADKSTGKTKSFYDVTEVEMYDVSDEEINAYIDTGDPFDKAGGYGVQSRGAFLVKSVNGDFYTVVGLPVARLYRELQSFKD